MFRQPLDCLAAVQAVFEKRDNSPLFYNLQGWSSSADPRRRAGAIKHIEAEDMKKEMNEVQMRKYAEYDDIRSSVSLKLYSS